MKSRLIFRLLGTLSSVLIIIAVFIPFINTPGYSPSLWQAYSDSLYLPIMIIAFGSIGVIMYLLNKKTEFAYMSTGAITFFVVMETISAINNNAFNAFGVGYYCLAGGAILTGIMAFFNNLNPKVKKVVAVPQGAPTPTNSSILSQLDGIYGNQNDKTTSMINNVSETNLVTPQVINPVFPGENISNQQVNPVLEEFNSSNSKNSTNVINQELNQPQPVAAPVPDLVQPQPVVAPVPDLAQPQPVVAPVPDLAQPQPAVAPIPDLAQPQPVVAPVPDLAQPQPVVAPVPDLAQPQPAVAPIPDLAQPQPAVAPIPDLAQPQPVAAPIPDLAQPQPVAAPIPDLEQPQPAVAPIPDLAQPQPVSTTVNNNANNSVDVDIFGQPLN